MVHRLALRSLAGVVTIVTATACGDDNSSSTTPSDMGDAAATQDTATSAATSSGGDTTTGAATTGETTAAATTDSPTTDVVDSSDSVSTDEAMMDSGADEPTTAPATDSPDAQAALPTIAELVSGSEDFTVLASALADTGLDADLAGEGPFTVFAPTDAAFDLLPAGLLLSLDNAELKNILLYHVVSGEVPAETVVTLPSADTLLGDSVTISVTDDGVFLNGLTQVVTTDVQTSNGIVHVIDSVLIPGAFPGSIVDVLGTYPRLSELASAATPNAVAALGGDNLTLLAPVNGSFEGVTLPTDEAELDAILLYHALPLKAPSSVVVGLKTAQSAGGPFMGIDTSDGVKINDGSKLVSVTYTDIDVDSGEQGSTIHLIDEVLIPPPSIAEVAQNAGLTSLVAAAAAANVPGTETTFAEALTSGEGPFTVFAPSNEAFAAIPEAGFGDDLANVLGAHAIAGVVDSNAVVAAIGADGLSPATLTGATENQLGLSLIGGAVAINAMVQVVATDIPASNGIIHLVDSIIVPADVPYPGTIVEAVSAYPLFSSLVDAVVNADSAVATALSGAGPLTLFAPVNPAFDGIDTSADLASILLYHALPAEYDSAAVVGLTEPTAFTTANGADVTIDGQSLTVNEASIVGTDLRTTNGIVHVIDQVLIPPSTP